MIFDDNKMNQLNISFPQASRNTDPITSHMAEQEITKKGIRGKQALLVYDLVKRFPNHTSRELATPKLDRYQIARRCSDLEDANLIRKSGMRICRVGGRQSVTWEAK